MNIIFANGTSLEYFDAINTFPYDGSVKRKGLLVKILNPTVSLDELNALLNDTANLETITLVNDQFPVVDENGEPTGEFTTITKVLDYYIIKNSISLEDLLIEAETSESPAVYAPMLSFELWQLTYNEIQQMKTAAQAEAAEAQAVYTAMMTDTLI